MTPNYAKILEELPPKIDLNNIPKDLALDEDEKEEELPFCEKCYKRLQVDERGQAVMVTFNEKGQEVSRSKSYNSGASNNCPCYVYGVDENGEVTATPVTSYEPSPNP